MKKKYAVLLATVLYQPLVNASTPASTLTLARTNLETVVVTATREEQQRRNLPESIEAFNAETISTVSPSHPSEILNRSAGVHINNLGGEGHMTAIRQPITTRGVYLYLEDGVPTRPSGFFNHNALYEVNIPQAGKLEVVKGPGSALYGSDAIGGMINAISKAPPDDRSHTLNLEGGSYGWQRALLSVGDTRGKHGYQANVNWTDNEGYRDASSYTRSAITTRWDNDATESLQIKTLFSYSDVDQSGVSNLEENDYRNNPRKNRFHGDTGFRKVESLRLSTEFSIASDDYSLLTLTPYFRDNTMAMSPTWMVTYDPNERESSFQSYGLLSKYRLAINDKTQVITGLDVDYSPSTYQESAVSHTLVDDIYIGYRSLNNRNYDFEATQTSLSSYLHIESSLTERLMLSAGLRYDYFTIDYNDKLDVAIADSIFIPQLGRPVTHLRPDDQSVSFNEWSPKLGLVYQLANEHDLYINYRHAFSIPSAGTLFRSGSTSNSENLQPIKADSIEMGFRGQANTWLYYEVALYQLQIEDDLVSVVNGFRRNIFNAGQTTHQGIEVAFNGNLTEEFAYSVAFTRTWQEYDSFSYTCCFPAQNIDVGGNDVGKAPKTIGNIIFSYAPIQLPGLRLEIEWEHLGKYYSDETNTSTYGGHRLYNLRANYQVNDSLEVYARVQNLSDELYSTYTSNQVGDPDISYQPGQARSAYAGIKLFF